MPKYSTPMLATIGSYATHPFHHSSNYTVCSHGMHTDGYSHDPISSITATMVGNRYLV